MTKLLLGDKGRQEAGRGEWLAEARATQHRAQELDVWVDQLLQNVSVCVFDELFTSFVISLLH